MSKRIFSLVIIVISIIGISFTGKPVTPAANKPLADDTAVVYIYRVGQFMAAGNNWSIWADGQKICKLSNNKFIRQVVKPGKHVYTAKVGGVGLMKKETEIEIDAEAGGSYYIACNVKQSFTRARLELVEVTKNTGNKQMEKMTVDNCQEKIDENSEQ